MNVPANGYGVFANPANSPASALKKPYLPSSEPKPKARESRLGLPRFKWSLVLLGLCIYTFAIITSRFPVGQLGIAVGVAGLFTGRDSVRTPAPFWLYLGFLLWALVSSFASPFTDVALGELLERLKLLVILLVAMNALRTEGQLQFYLLFVLGCFILFPARGTFLGGDTIGGGRVVWTGAYNNPNDLACLCLLALGIAIAITFSETTWTFVRLGAASGALILLVVILRTQSRGAFLGVMVATAPAFIPMLLKQLRLAIGVGIVVALVISFAIPPKTWDRLVGITKLTSTEAIENQDNTNEADSSATQRLEILKVGWKIFLDHPVFGIGLGAYPLACNMYSPSIGKRDTHNTYLNLASELGLPGFLIWCSLIGSVLFHAYRIRRHAKESLLKVQNYWLGQTFIGYLVAGSFGSYSALNLLYLMLSVLWCSTDLLAKASQPQIHHAAGARRA